MPIFQILDFLVWWSVFFFFFSFSWTFDKIFALLSEISWELFSSAAAFMFTCFGFYITFYLKYLFLSYLLLFIYFYFFFYFYLRVGHKGKIEVVGQTVGFVNWGFNSSTRFLQGGAVTSSTVFRLNWGSEVQCIVWANKCITSVFIHVFTFTCRVLGALNFSAFWGILILSWIPFLLVLLADPGRVIFFRSAKSFTHLSACFLATHMLPPHLFILSLWIFLTFPSHSSSFRLL